ncbi:MAG: PKD domain-containing protein [Bacteroidota bacterium]
MKKIYNSIIMLSMAFVIFSCGDDETPLPLPTVNFAVDPSVVEVGLPIMFDNLSTNADNYEWDFGGALTSTDISPIVTFETPGTFDVTLRAFTQDGQVDSVTRQVRVRQRILTGIFVNTFPIMNGDEQWDPDETNQDSVFADIFLQFLPNDPANIDGVVAGPVDEVTEGFGLNIDPNLNEVILTDDDWSLRLFDFDGDDPNDVNEDNTEFMIGVQFNPVQAITFKNDDGDAGFISILFQDPQTGDIIDVDLTFQLE